MKMTVVREGGGEGCEEDHLSSSATDGVNNTYHVVSWITQVADLIMNERAPPFISLLLRDRMWWKNSSWLLTLGFYAVQGSRGRILLASSSFLLLSSSHREPEACGS